MVCTKCKADKPLSGFYKRNSEKNIYHVQCKLCQKAVGEIYNLNNKEKIDARSRSPKNKERVSLWHKQNRAENGDELNAKNKIYCLENRDKINKRKSAKDRERYNTDPMFRLTNILRKRMIQAFKSQSWRKNGSSEFLIGIDFKKAFAHIESLFTEGMSWDLMGYKIHIDHIIPVTAFNLLIEEAQLMCFNYKNLRPMWDKANFEKKRQSFR